MRDQSLYAKILELGLKHDNHYSDLYLLASGESKQLLKDHGMTPWPSTFVDNIDGKIYYDIPFAYEPFWEGKPSG